MPSTFDELGAKGFKFVMLSRDAWHGDTSYAAPEGGAR